MEFIKFIGKVKYHIPSDRWSLEGVELNDFDTNNLLDGVDQCLSNVNKERLNIDDEITIIIRRREEEKNE